jgi:outer membrane protein assembly factor BamB
LKKIIIPFVVFILLACLIPVQLTSPVDTSSNELEQQMSSMELYLLRRSYPYEDRASHDLKCFSSEQMNLGVNEMVHSSSSLVSSSVGSRGPMNSSWPMQSHDVKHTGCSQYSTTNNYGAEIWRIHGDKAGGVESSSVIDNKGSIYIGTLGSDSSLYALYPNGTRRWKYHANGLIWSSSAIADDGTIYLPSSGSHLIALYPNGQMKWDISAQDPIASSVTIGEDDIIYIGTMGGNLYAISPNGTEQWHLYLGGNLISSPAIGLDNIIYIGTTSQYLYAVNPNGSKRWQFGAGQFKGNPSIAEDGTIYAPSFDGCLYALNPNGSMKWRATTGSSVAAAGVALAEDGTIYVGTELLRAYYPNGTLRWSADVQGNVYGTVPAVSADGTIYVSAGDSLVAVNPDGSERWRQTLSNEQVRSSPSIGENDRVYVGSTYSDYGYLHAFGPSDPNTPDAPTITGQTNGRIKRTYDYTFTSTSPLENQLYYLIDWGDGTTTDWLGPYNSGESLTMEHSWSTKGTYIITARAKDTGNLWGPWGNLSVTMPYEPPHFRLLEWLLERFPNAFPILRYFFDH